MFFFSRKKLKIPVWGISYFIFSRDGRKKIILTIFFLSGGFAFLNILILLFRRRRRTVLYIHQPPTYLSCVYLPRFIQPVFVSIFLFLKNNLTAAFDNFCLPYDIHEMLFRFTIEFDLLTMGGKRKEEKMSGQIFDFFFLCLKKLLLFFYYLANVCCRDVTHSSLSL
jgi:hypothetical protein